MSKRAVRLLDCRLLLPGLLGLGGCEWTLPGRPLAHPTAAVVGKVTIAGQPVGHGWITLLPFGGTVGDHVIGRIRDDGTFDLARSPVGQLAVQVAISESAIPQALAAQPALLARLRQCRGPGTPLRLKTEPDAPGRYEIDVLRQQVRRLDR